MKTLISTLALLAILAAAVSCSKAEDVSPATPPSTDTLSCWACYTQAVYNSDTTWMQDTICYYTPTEIRKAEASMLRTDSNFKQTMTCVYSSIDGGT